MIALHRALGTWQSRVDAYIALTEFQRDLLQRSGLPPGKMHVKPNPISAAGEILAWGSRENKVVFAGRLSHEKGVSQLLEAWAQWGPEAPLLELIGGGSGAENLIQQANTLGLSAKVRFTGHLRHAEVLERVRWAKLAVVPSLSYEGLPMALLEALSLGVPVAASRIGSLPSAIRHDINGVLFHPASADALLAEVRPLWSNRDRLERLSAGALTTFAHEFSEPAVYRKLMDVYGAALECRGQRCVG